MRNTPLPLPRRIWVAHAYKRGRGGPLAACPPLTRSPPPLRMGALCGASRRLCGQTLIGAQCAVAGAFALARGYLSRAGKHHHKPCQGRGGGRCSA